MNLILLVMIFLGRLVFGLFVVWVGLRVRLRSSEKRRVNSWCIIFFFVEYELGGS